MQCISDSWCISDSFACMSWCISDSSDTAYPIRRGGCQVRPTVLCMCLTTYYHESHCGSYRIQKQCYIVNGDRTSSNFGAQAPGLAPRIRNIRAGQNVHIFEATMVVQRGAIGLKSLLVFHHRTCIDGPKFHGPCLLGTVQRA